MNSVVTTATSPKAISTPLCTAEPPAPGSAHGLQQTSHRGDLYKCLMPAVIPGCGGSGEASGHGRVFGGTFAAIALARPNGGFGAYLNQSRTTGHAAMAAPTAAMIVGMRMYQNRLASISFASALSAYA